MIVGVTGTRYGRENEALEKLRQTLKTKGAKEFHHGDCEGWDEQAHFIAKQLGLRIVVHPPDDDRHRAWCSGGLVLPPKPYLERNRDIVNAIQFLIAAPDGPERTRSGTWSTVRYAKKRGVPGVIYTPPSLLNPPQPHTVTERHSRQWS